MKHPFENIGALIKDTALLLFYLQLFAGIVWAAVEIAFANVVFGAIVLVASLASAALSTMMLYGFGELIETNIAIKKYLYKNSDITADENQEELAGNDAYIKCPDCGSKQKWERYTCSKCGCYFENIKKTGYTSNVLKDKTTSVYIKCAKCQNENIITAVEFINEKELRCSECNNPLR